MVIKPIVALVLPKDTAVRMFRAEDLDRLRAEADLLGPMDAHGGVALADCAVAITGWGSPPFDAALLAGAPKLKLVAHSAGSVKSVVSDALYARGIKVTTAAAANAIPVAQLTVAMMITMLKQVPWITAPYGEGKHPYGAPIKNCPRELQDIAVGLVGASRIGREVIRLLKTHTRIDIRVYDPYLDESQARALGVTRAPLEDVCSCPVVSVHAPSTPETRHMINARSFARMPDHAVFINTSRGALVDESALVAEVRRRPLYAWLDVTDPEPPALDSPLRQEPSILLTPHLSGAISQGCWEMGRLAIDETLRFLRGEPLQHEVTRDMLRTQA